MSKNKKTDFKKYAMALSIGYYLIGSIVGGLISGVFIDKWLKTSPIFTLILLITGIIYGLYMTIKISMNIDRP
jgi:F0F1-type ATP synthase assembly protein I